MENILSVIIPKVPITIIPNITISDLDICCASNMRYPIPEEAAISSAPIIALQLYPIPNFNPIKISGTELGSIIFKNISFCDISKTFPTSIYFLSQPSTPFSTFKNTGKNDANTIITILEVSPIPNQRIIIGISARGGV